MSGSRRGRVVLIALGLLLTPAAGATQASTGADSASRPAPIIRAVDIRRAPVFDSLEARFWGYRALNALHALTRPRVVRRELLFAEGEPYDTARVNESARNLRALGIFRDVEIDSVRTDSGLVVRVTTTDGWTTGVSLNVETSGSQAVFSVGVTDRNLLGAAAIATIGYLRNPDRSSVRVGLDVPRAILNTVGLGVSYLDRSDGRAGAASIRYPFFTLASRRGASLSTQFLDARVLRFVGGARAPADSVRRLFSILRADAAIALAAGPGGYTRVGVVGQLRRDDFGPEGGSAAIPRTVTAALGPFIAVRSPQFIEVRNYESLGRLEDIDLGLRMRAGILFAPGGWGYDRNGIGGSLGIGIGRRIPSGFVQLEGSAGALRSTGGIDSATVEASGTLVVQPGERHLWVGHAAVGLRKNPYPGGEFDLGLDYAVRAFPAHAFTGDRQVLLNAEYRWLMWPRLLGLVGVGVAAFADHAGAWYNGSPRRVGTDAGIGLRLGAIRQAAGIVGRVDLAYRFANDVAPAGWVLSLGRGFVFQRF